MSGQPRTAWEPDDKELNQRVRAQLWRRLAIGALVVAVLMLLCTTTYTVVQMRATQKSNGLLLQVVLDCTTPGKGCYERGQAQIGHAVSNINRVSVIAAACASGPDRKTVPEIEACINRALSKPRRP